MKEYQVFFISMILVIMISQAQNGIAINHRTTPDSFITECLYGCEKRIDFYRASDFIRRIKEKFRSEPEIPENNIPLVFMNQISLAKSNSSSHFDLGPKIIRHEKIAYEVG